VAKDLTKFWTSIRRAYDVGRKVRASEATIGWACITSAGMMVTPHSVQGGGVVATDAYGTPCTLSVDEPVVVIDNYVDRQIDWAK
jgi:hypothetical protein